MEVDSLRDTCGLRQNVPMSILWMFSWLLIAEPEEYVKQQVNPGTGHIVKFEKHSISTAMVHCDAPQPLLHRPAPESKTRGLSSLKLVGLAFTRISDVVRFAGHVSSPNRVQVPNTGYLPQTLFKILKTECSTYPISA